MSTELNKKFAIIDLGSNSFHLLLGTIFSNGIWQVEQRISEAVQLRSGLTQEGTLSWESINRALTCLDAFALKLTKFSPSQTRVRIVGTATLRFAKNRELFVSHATKKLGYPIEVISEKEEARLVYLAFVHYLRQEKASDFLKQKILGLDVGGGSTELMVGLAREDNPRQSVSLPVGCVELQSYFMAKEGLCPENFERAAKCVEAKWMESKDALQVLMHYGWQYACAGSGSAEILLEVAQVLGSKLKGELSFSVLTEIKAYLISLKDYQQLNLLGLKDHQLQILPGVVTIFLVLMQLLHLEKMSVLPVALRHGIMVAMHSATMQPLEHNS